MTPAQHPITKRYCIVASMILCFVCMFGFVRPAKALEITQEYLDRAYDWTVFLEASQVTEYFNYKSSKLHPLTKVRVFIQKSSRTITQREEPLAYIYEDFWYFNGKCIGMHRKHALDLRRDSHGVIVLRKSEDKPGQAMSATNAALRMLMELQLGKLGAETFLISEGDYEEVAACLSEFNFYRGLSPTSGKQLSLTLRQYPDEKQEHFYYLSR